MSSYLTFSPLLPVFVLRRGGDQKQAAVIFCGTICYPPGADTRLFTGALLSAVRTFLLSAKNGNAIARLVANSKNNHFQTVGRAVKNKATIQQVLLSLKENSMYYSRLLPTLLGFICLSIALAISCKKSPHTQPAARCESLQDGMRNNDVNEVKTQITRFIDKLPSQEYTAQNLDKLAAAISGQCGTTVQVLCFDCIKTEPGQSEIKISLPASSIQKVIDISYTLSSPKMKVINMHD